MRKLVLALAVALLYPGFAAASEVPVPPGLDALWVNPGETLPGQHVTMEVRLQPAYDAAQPAVFPCLIRCRSFHGGSTVVMRLFDAAGKAVKEGKIPVDLQRGHNQVEFELNLADVPPGEYTARFVANYAKDFPPAVVTAQATRVNTESLEGLLATLAPRVETLAAQVAEAEANGRQLRYVRTQLFLARRALVQAREDLDADRWHAARDHIAFIQSACHRGFAAFVLTDQFPERAARPHAEFGPLAIAHGQTERAGRPAFPLGLRLNGPDTATLGLDFVVLPLSPAVTFPTDRRPAPLGAPYDAFFAEAARTGTAVIVELDPAGLPGWFLDQHPGVLAAGQADLTQAPVRELLEQHYAAVLPYLAGQAAVLGVTLLDAPRFHFDGEDIRRRFVEYVRVLYPDRLNLTRAWRAHLGAYDDITIWDDRLPWQAGRTFQFDWQSFHRDLGTQYLDWAQGIARAQGGALSIGIGLDDNAFLAAESRSGVDREAVARLMDFQSLAGAVAVDDPVFGLRYPGPFAGYTLARSMAPGKILYNLRSEFLIGQDLALDHARDFVHAAVWESALCGVAAHAIDLDSPLMARPEALEGFITAGLDLNRLGDLVAAFSRVPADIGILFSAASKILDDGVPHLATARSAYEGASFSGFNVRFVTEAELAAGELDRLALLILPETPAVPDETFARIAAYVEQGRPIIRPGAPIPYNERGQSRADVLRPTGKTVLVRDPGQATEYLHAIDAVVNMNVLPNVPRPINAHGFPLEGVRTRYIEREGVPYLYLLNVRRDAVRVHLAGNLQAGRDLIRGVDVQFPLETAPLQPMLIALDTAPFVREAGAAKPVEEMSRKERRRHQRELRDEEARVHRMRL